MTKTILTPSQADLDVYREIFLTDPRDGCPAAERTLQHLANHRLTARKEGEALGMEKSAGMKPWRGGDVAPADWDGGNVLWEDGIFCKGRADQFRHGEIVGEVETAHGNKMPVRKRIIAYTAIREASHAD